MWQAQYEKVFHGISKESVWSAWADVNSWSRWDLDTDYTEIQGPFLPGTSFILKPKGGPRVNIEITEVDPGLSFTDVTKFPGAKMYDTHTLEETADGLKIKSIIRIEGPLSWVWKKIVAEGVAAGVPKQMEALVGFLKNK